MTNTMAQPFSWKRTALEWLATDAPVLTYMAKATFAGLLALVISMTLNLPDPRTAIFTTFLVMQPQSGLVFSKSYYRVLGTIAGVGVSLLMMGLFAQDPVWFIAFFALWIGLCTGAGLKFRNFQSYGFVLAGYTLCIVALPVIETPLEIFSIAVSRFSEVIIGIMSATLVSDMVFPRKLFDSLLASERERFANLFAILGEGDALFAAGTETEPGSAGFSGVVGLHAVRINSSFESGTDRKARQLSGQLNQEYMHLSTTFHSLKNILAAAGERMPIEVRESLAGLYAPVASVVNASPRTPVSVEELDGIIAGVLEAKQMLQTLVEEEQRRLAPYLEADAYEAFSSASGLIVRLLGELHIHCVTYRAFLRHRLSGRASRELSRVVRFSTHTDSVLVALAALRGSGVLLVTMLFWIVTGWPYATLTVTLAVVLGLLIGTLPSPLAAVMNFFKGGVSAVAVAAVYDFYIIPEYTSDMLTLALVLAPVLAVVAWWTTQPRWSGFALGFIFLFMYQCSLDPYYRVDPTVFLESTLAYLIGIGFAGLAYLLVNFWSCSLTQQRVAKILRRQIVTLCSGTITVQRSALESTGRDMVQQFSTQGRLNLRSSRLVYAWLLSTLEIGRAVIAVRRGRKRLPLSAASDSVDGAIYAIRNYFATPSEQMRRMLLATLKEAVAVLHAQGASAGASELKRIKKAAAELALIRTIMLSEGSLPVVMEDTCR
ncbi:FUSC family protein [Sulfurimonas sp. HSL1-2]|uniref:FUSC family protein n=1 Tax=Thiomicrolovo zhangzhouensis TaxID=3131933 RepID=UPI0031F9A66B